MFKLFKHLVPKSQAWNLVAAGRVREFFMGLAAGLLQPLRDFIDNTWLDMFPGTTRDLTAWEWQFGLQPRSLTEQERRDKIDAAWKSFSGGQDPRYLQDTLQASGFDAYVHDWWVPLSNPAVSRDPFDTEYGYMLVNKLYTAEMVSVALCGEPLMECGEPLAECGEFTSVVLNPVYYPIPTDPNDWPYIVYIGAEVWGELAVIDPTRREEFEDLCLKLFPLHNWLMINVIFGETSLLIDGDMEDLDIPDWDPDVTDNLLADGNMEGPGKEYWTDAVGTFIDKDSFSYSGTQSMMLLSGGPA